MATHAHSTPPNCDKKTIDDVGRRLLLSAGPALLMAPAGAAPLSQDAALLQDCAAYARLQRELDAFDLDRTAGTPVLPAVEAARTRIIAAQWAHLERICTEQPSTPAGFAAVAATLTLVDPEIAVADPADGFLTDRLMAALLCGLTGVARLSQHADRRGK